MRIQFWLFSDGHSKRKPGWLLVIDTVIESLDQGDSKSASIPTCQSKLTTEKRANWINIFNLSCFLREKVLAEPKQPGNFHETVVTLTLVISIEKHSHVAEVIPKWDGKVVSILPCASIEAPSLN